MNWMLALLALLLLTGAANLFITCRLLWTLWLAQEDLRVTHSACIAHVASVTSHRFLADRLRDYADRWDSTDEQPALRRLASERYSPGGPSMPAIWLQVQAEQLDEEVSDG